MAREYHIGQEVLIDGVDRASVVEDYGTKVWIRRLLPEGIYDPSNTEAVERDRVSRDPRYADLAYARSFEPWGTRGQR